MTLLDAPTTERGRRQSPLRERARAPWPLRVRDPVPPASREVAPAPDHRTRDRRSLRALLVADVVGTTTALALCAPLPSIDVVARPSKGPAARPGWSGASRPSASPTPMSRAPRAASAHGS